MSASGATRSYHHRGGEQPLIGATLPEQLASVAARFPEREAVVSLPADRRLSYMELLAEVDAVARGLIAMGFERGERVGVWSTNHIEWLLLQLATARVGVVLVNVNPANRLPELTHALSHADVHGLVLSPGFRASDYVATLLELLPALETKAPDALGGDAPVPSLRRVVIFDPERPSDTVRPAPGFTTWAELIDAGRGIDAAALDARTASLDPDDPINIQFTSGTTGFPKPVVLTHHNLLNDAWFAARGMRFTEEDRLCVPVPFYHCFGMVLSNLLSLSVGATLVIPAEHFEPGATLEAIARERCTAVHGVPTMFVAMLDHPDFERLHTSSLRTGIMAGAPCPPALMRRVMDELGCREILIGYGQTEASPLTHLTDPDDSLERRVESVGRNLPHQEVKIVDPASGATVPLGADGEVCFRGYHVMRGYFGDPEATARAVDQSGWLHSGDLGCMDADGYLRITGRLKELVIRGGENIYPGEIEQPLTEHPAIAQAAVVGVPDPYWGEDLVAWVQLHPGARATAEELQSYLRERIAHYKVPARIRFVDAFPMTVTGKIQKFRMREAELGERAA